LALIELKIAVNTHRAIMMNLMKVPMVKDRITILVLE